MCYKINSSAQQDNTGPPPEVWEFWFNVCSTKEQKIKVPSRPLLFTVTALCNSKTKLTFGLYSRNTNKHWRITLVARLTSLFSSKSFCSVFGSGNRLLSVHWRTKRVPPPDVSGIIAVILALWRITKWTTIDRKEECLEKIVLKHFVLCCYVVYGYAHNGSKNERGRW